MFPAGRHDDQVDSTSQALGYHFHTSADADNWTHFLKTRAANSGPPEPSIRLNHVNKELEFRLYLGRIAPRQSDGSFLVTQEEYDLMRGLEGLWEVEEPD